VYAILRRTVQTDCTVYRVEDGQSDFQPRQHERFFGQEASMPPGLGRHRRQGRDIAIPNIFFEKTGDKFT
jgi:hypothetical protein